MKKIILLGGGGHAVSCIDLLSNSKEFKIAGYVALSENKNLNLKYLGKDSDLINIKNKYSFALIAIGQIKNSILRESKYKLLKKYNFILPNIFSNISYISKNIKIGECNTIFHHAIINSNCLIGNNNIINSKTLIEHNVRLGNNNHLSTSAIINGNCKIGNNNFIGSGAIINNDIKIGNNCIIASGSLVKKDINDFAKIQ